MSEDKGRPSEAAKIFTENVRHGYIFEAQVEATQSEFDAILARVRHEEDCLTLSDWCGTCHYWHKTHQPKDGHAFEPQDCDCPAGPIFKKYGRQET